MASHHSLIRPSCLFLISWAAAGIVEPAAGQTIVDLTHPFDEHTIYWPTEKGFVLERGPAGVTERGYFYAANRFAAPEHGGTHIDAPVHFWKGGQTVDQIPLERLMGEGACVDVSRQCAADRDNLVTVEDFEKWERDQGESLEDKIVLIRTGWGQKWPAVSDSPSPNLSTQRERDREAYLGTAAVGREAVRQLHFPGLDPAAAEWLAVRRRVRSVGIDTASIDHGPSLDFGSHVNLFRHGVPAVENVAAMDALPALGFRVMALPMKIGGGSGAPCRVVAVVGGEGSRE